MGWRTGADCWVQKHGSLGTNGIRPGAGRHIVLLQMVKTSVCIFPGARIKEKLCSRHAVSFDCSQN